MLAIVAELKNISNSFFAVVKLSGSQMSSLQVASARSSSNISGKSSLSLEILSETTFALLSSAVKVSKALLKSAMLVAGGGGIGESHFVNGTTTSAKFGVIGLPVMR